MTHQASNYSEDEKRGGGTHTGSNLTEREALEDAVERVERAAEKLEEAADRLDEQAVESRVADS